MDNETSPFIRNGRALNKLVINEVEVYRYNDEDAKSVLQEMGEYLYSLQTSSQNQQDSMGFNSHDLLAWDMSRGEMDVDRLRFLLKKYKRQLNEHSVYKHEYEYTGLSTFNEKAIIKFYLTDGSLISALIGKLDKKLFTSYRDIHKNYGFNWSSLKNAWVLKNTNFKSFDSDSFIKDLSLLEIKVNPFPALPIIEEPDLTSADSVIKGIADRTISEGYIVVKRTADGKIAFYAPYSSEFNQLFNNNSGKLSGITEYNPSNHARETYDICLAEEAILKLQQLLPDWKLITEGMNEARIERELSEQQLRLPMPEVQAIINPSYTLFPYQNEAVRFLNKTNGNALIGDEMGLGKTLQTLAWVVSNNKRILVVVPKVVRRTWILEAMKFFPSYFTNKSKELISKEIKKSGMPDLSGVNLATVNYESLDKFLPAILSAGFDTIAIDESHRMKNPKAKITTTLFSIRDLFKHHILLSGTAIKNNRGDMATQLNYISPGASSLLSGTHGQVWNKLRELYIARQKRTVLADLPEKITAIIEIETPGMPSMPSTIGEMSAAKIKAALAKVHITKEFVTEILESSDSNVLVFSESMDATLTLAKELGDIAILHHGQMSDNKREEAKQEFQNPNSKKRVFVSTRQSLAVGATLTRADKVVFNDLPWTGADIRQAEDRVHRVGQTNNVNVYWITAKDNDWDSNLSQIILRKYELNKRLNEGKQISEEEREWMNTPVTLNEIREKGAR